MGCPLNVSTINGPTIGFYTIGIFHMRCDMMQIYIRDKNGFQGPYLGIVMYNPILTNMKVFQILISNSPNSTIKTPKAAWKNIVVPSSES